MYAFLFLTNNEVKICRCWLCVSDFNEHTKKLEDFEFLCSGSIIFLRGKFYTEIQIVSNSVSLCIKHGNALQCICWTVNLFYQHSTWLFINSSIYLPIKLSKCHLCIYPSISLRSIYQYLLVDLLISLSINNSSVKAHSGEKVVQFSLIPQRILQNYQMLRSERRKLFLPSTSKNLPTRNWWD